MPCPRYVFCTANRSVLLRRIRPVIRQQNRHCTKKNGNLHKAFDHKRFAENMKQCPHKWLITYDYSQYVRELFSFSDKNSESETFV